MRSARTRRRRCAAPVSVQQNAAALGRPGALRRGCGVGSCARRPDRRVDGAAPLGGRPPTLPPRRQCHITNALLLSRSDVFWRDSERNSRMTTRCIHPRCCKLRLASWRMRPLFLLGQRHQTVRVRQSRWSRLLILPCLILSHDLSAFEGFRANWTDILRHRVSPSATSTHYGWAAKPFLLQPEARSRGLASLPGRIQDWGKHAPCPLPSTA